MPPEQTAPPLPLPLPPPLVSPPSPYDEAILASLNAQAEQLRRIADVAEAWWAWTRGA